MKYFPLDDCDFLAGEFHVIALRLASLAPLDMLKASRTFDSQEKPETSLTVTVLLASNGAEGTRTPDLLIANQPLSQLSYGPAGPGKYIGTRLIL